MDGLPQPVAPRNGGRALTFLALPFRWVRLLRREQMVPLKLLTRMSAPLDDLLTVLFQQVPAGMAVIDRQGDIVRVNDVLAAITRGAADLSPGRSIAGLFAPGRRDEAWAELSAALADRRAMRPLVSVIAGRDGADVTMEVTASPLREADGALSGLVIRLSDMTVQRKLEAQLEQSQKLQALGQLAGGIAHDFNNLLTAILSAADEQLHRAVLDAEAVADMVQIRRSAERGAALVRQLLAFGRQQTLQPSVVRLDAAVDEVSGLLRRLLGSRVTLALDVACPAAKVRVDPTQLEQVLVNLAVNARDAMPDGGTLTLRSGYTTLFEATTWNAETIPPGHYAMLEVRDTGVGIDPEVLPRIFDPFFTTRRDAGGHGLGLSTVHGIVRQSGGFLTVDSTRGEGTSICIYLPREDDDAPLTIPHPPAPGTPSAESPEAATPDRTASEAAVPEPAMPMTAVASSDKEMRRVLLVDDEDAVRNVGERALTRRGWTVMSAASAEEAIALVPPDIDIDIVVSDVVMPGMDGPALVRALRLARPGLPAILASGYAESSLRAELTGPGLRFIAKPYSLKQLAAVMDEMLAPANHDRLHDRA